MDINKHSEGFNAATEGKEHWQNPYKGMDEDPADFVSWYAGWCDGMTYLKG